MKGQRLELMGNRVGNFLVAEAEIDVPDGRAAVEILLAVGVPYENAFTAGDDQRAFLGMLRWRREAGQLVLAIEFVQPLGVDFKAQRALRARGFLCCSH